MLLLPIATPETRLRCYLGHHLRELRETLVWTTGSTAHRQVGRNEEWPHQSGWLPQLDTCTPYVFPFLVYIPAETSKQMLSVFNMDCLSDFVTSASESRRLKQMCIRDR